MTPVVVFVVVVIVVVGNNTSGHSAVGVMLTIHQEQLNYFLLIEDRVLS